MASLLLEGKGGTPDYAEVRSLCEKAAKARYSPATYCMGELYAKGLGVERDLPKAAQWFTDAANMGHALSALRLGEMYWKGEGQSRRVVPSASPGRAEGQVRDSELVSGDGCWASQITLTQSCRRCNRLLRQSMSTLLEFVTAVENIHWKQKVTTL